MSRTPVCDTLGREFRFLGFRPRNFLPLTILFLSVAGCGSLELKSHWRERPVLIDGNIDEWKNAMVQIEGKPWIVGLMNDSNYLYVAFVTTDRPLQRQIMFRGMTLWFDHEGGEERRFGIKFPLGFEGMRQREYAGDFQNDPAREDTLTEGIPSDTSEAEIFGPGPDEHHRVRLEELKQVALKMDLSQGRLTYELRVPLTDNGPDPYAIGTRIGTEVGVGIETTPRLGRSGSGGESGRSEMPGGGIGREGGRRGRGGYGGGYGGSRSSRSGQEQEPLSLWAKVALSSSSGAN